jgi:hypothetical protein
MRGSDLEENGLGGTVRCPVPFTVIEFLQSAVSGSLDGGTRWEPGPLLQLFGLLWQFSFDLQVVDL